MTVRIGVACEDNGHFQVCSRLIDVSLLRAHPWLDGVLESCRAFCGVDEGAEWAKLADLDQRGLARPRKLHGFIGGRPLAPEAKMWRTVLSHFEEMTPRPEAVLLIRDLDNHRSRLEGLGQARDGLDWPFAILAATPQPEIEAWQIASFEPRTSAESAYFSLATNALSFDPRTDSDRLTSHPNDAPTDAKRVWKIIQTMRGQDPDDFGELADLDRLRQRGRMNHLADFLDEINTRLAPIFGQPERPAHAPR